jgi:DNA-binding transcriptional regulator YhcF (GntR family)
VTFTPRIEHGGPVPPFDQLKQQVRDAVESGRLVAGDKLPTVRGLAERVGLAPNTVARAYRELEAEGVLDTRGRSGTFVSAGGTDSAARAAAAAYVARTRALGIPDAEARRLVERTLRGG